MHDALALHVNSTLHGLSSLHSPCNHTYPTHERASNLHDMCMDHALAHGNLLIQVSWMVKALA